MMCRWLMLKEKQSESFYLALNNTYKQKMYVKVNV